ncbi:hypothetical protein [Methylorubrum suomiense]|uniref:Uncharacterized protein n=1 Tax=Methylorubrum suomiense TaxID=144191 RepID=A0ABQ4V182_9HYPH|nr:hypothetical protein [Methylorubrum suomiense]GJE78050.1 hypothetical protein BGCPKDLD_4661 [Methylorubrum suomiense]
MIDPAHYDSSIEPEEAATAERRRQAGKPMNRLVVIGWAGVMRAYLNVPREEAITRYVQDEGEPPAADQIKEFEFTDSFGVYDAWAHT